MLSRLVRSVASALALVELLAILCPVSYHPILLDDSPNLAAAILATTRGPGSHTSAHFTVTMRCITVYSEQYTTEIVFLIESSVKQTALTPPIQPSSKSPTTLLLLPISRNLTISLRIRPSNLKKVRRPLALDVPPTIVNRLTLIRRICVSGLWLLWQL